MIRLKSFSELVETEVDRRFEVDIDQLDEAFAGTDRQQGCSASSC